MTDFGRVFNSVSSFDDFIAHPIDLGAASGSQDVAVTLVEMLSGTESVSWQYALATAPGGSITGAQSAVPLPPALPMFGTAVLGLGLFGRRRARVL